VEAFSLSLMVTTTSVALVHALVGPDHWLPFVMLSRARGWTLAKTALITTACGIGHVVSSIALGLFGTALGWQATRLAGVESARGELASWLLVAFGVAYAAWGTRRAIRRRRGLHLHDHDGVVHLHGHGGAAHDHQSGGAATATVFWALFVLFVLGPCEPMIPLLVAPASRGQWALAASVAAVFLVVTLAVMLAAVIVLRLGFERASFGRLERWSHALAGGAIASCGLAVLLLGV